MDVILGAVCGLLSWLDIIFTSIFLNYYKAHNYKDWQDMERSPVPRFLMKHLGLENAILIGLGVLPISLFFLCGLIRDTGLIFLGGYTIVMLIHYGNLTYKKGRVLKWTFQYS